MRTIEEMRKLPWYVNTDGGAWAIYTVKEDIVADELPFGALADYIVDMHNSKIELNSWEDLVPSDYWVTESTSLICPTCGCVIRSSGHEDKKHHYDYHLRIARLVGVVRQNNTKPPEMPPGDDPRSGKLMA